MRKNLIGSIVTAAAVLALGLAPTPAAGQAPAGRGGFGGRGGRGPGAAAAPAEVKPAPRLPDGKPDLGATSGIWSPIWVQDWASRRFVGKDIEVPYRPWAKALFDKRQANLSKDDPQGWCLPAGLPRYTGTPYPFQMYQLRDRILVLYERANDWRIIWMDGRKHSKDPWSWMGESIGWWEDDTLVVDSIGFNGKTWLDYVGHPTTDALHVVEKFRRPDYATLEYEATIDDAKAYTKPWTTSFKIPFRQGQDLMEYVCNENNKDVLHMSTEGPEFNGPPPEFDKSVKPFIEPVTK